MREARPVSLTQHEVTRILGPIDDAKVSAILAAGLDRQPDTAGEQHGLMIVPPHGNIRGREYYVTSSEEEIHA